jgi:glycosyltransferase involved in cell wall biosynthesis
MKVVHISFDYPDRIDINKTKAVENLVASQNSSECVVFSLNRSANPFKNYTTVKNSNVFSMRVFGLPYGIFLFLWMYAAYRRIYKIIIAEKIAPTLIHGHKLAFEGIVAFLLSGKLNIPYILTIRGDSDMKLFKHKPTYRFLFKTIANHARKIIFLAPWAIKKAREYLGNNLSEKSVVIPNIISIKPMPCNGSVKENKFLTVLNFNNFRRKRINDIIKACDHVFSKYSDYSVDIVGDGKYKNRVKKFIQKANHSSKFRLIGRVEHGDLLNMYMSYKGFILPSYPETFGLVFIEALVGGVPIIYAKNAGIDGYFNKWKVGVRVQQNSIDDIIAAIESIIEQQDKFTEEINKMTMSGYLKKFSKNFVAKQYNEVINACASRDA